MMDLLLLALLLAAVAIGWWLGRRSVAGNDETTSQARLSRDYFVGLNYLLNEEPDRAIETFVNALEVNSDTIETHIALGSLFRARGEADRSVKIHQNLLARPALTPAQGQRVQLELARDFLKLGLHDRAERLLQGITREAQDDELRLAAKRLLVDLLEREKAWQAALEVAVPELVHEQEELRRAASHWLCELAEQALQQASPGPARKQLRQALSIDPQCVRATWLLARLEHDTGHYKAEAKLLKRIPDQDLDFSPIILEPLAEAYRRLEDPRGFENYLVTLIERAPFTSALLALAKSRQHHDGNAAAEALIREQLLRTPSLRALDYLMDLYARDADAEERERIELLKQHTEALLARHPRFRCRRCGFSGERLHWQCPSCREWGTTKPVTGIEGE